MKLRRAHVSDCVKSTGFQTVMRILGDSPPLPPSLACSDDSHLFLPPLSLEPMQAFGLYEGDSVFHMAGLKLDKVQPT
jgi:hypothetical protein